MNFSSTIQMMKQQLGVLDNLDKLLAHDAKEKGAHGIAPDRVEALRTYSATMRTACEATQSLAVFYNLGTGKTEPAAPTAPATPEPKPVDSDAPKVSVSTVGPKPKAAKKPKQEAAPKEESLLSEPAPTPELAGPELEPPGEDDLGFLD